MIRYITNTISISIILISTLTVARAQVTEYSYATGNVSGQNYVGGFAGKVSGSGAKVNDCYARGQVTGNSISGGFTGSNEGEITNCYATGKVTANEKAGGFAGTNSGLVTNSYWDTQSSAISTSAGGTGKITSLMTYQNAVTNLKGFDFTKIWITDKSPLQNNAYPLLANSPVYQLEIRSLPYGAGVVGGSGYFKSGEIATVNALPGSSFVFKGWKTGTEIISTELLLNYPVTGNTVLFAVFENKSTGTRENLIKSPVECLVYPNPVSHFLSIELTGGVNITSTAIYSIDGKKWLETREQIIDVRRLESGIYIVKCQSGNESFFTKFIRE